MFNWVPEDPIVTFCSTHTAGFGSSGSWPMAHQQSYALLFEASEQEYREAGHGMMPDQADMDRDL